MGACCVRPLQIAGYVLPGIIWSTIVPASPVRFLTHIVNYVHPRHALFVLQATFWRAMDHAIPVSRQCLGVIHVKIRLFVCTVHHNIIWLMIPVLSVQHLALPVLLQPSVSAVLLVTISSTAHVCSAHVLHAFLSLHASPVSLDNT